MKLKLWIVVLVSVLGMSGCATGGERGWWTPPSGGVVRDKTAAISIAHAVWFSMHPAYAVAPVAKWQGEMEAHLDGTVWHVSERPLGKDEIGGRLYIDVSATDGRILQIVMTQ